MCVKDRKMVMYIAVILFVSTSLFTLHIDDIWFDENTPRTEAPQKGFNYTDHTNSRCRWTYSVHKTCRYTNNTNSDCRRTHQLGCHV